MTEVTESNLQSKAGNLPPDISVETAKDGSSDGEKTCGQARTPKHANKKDEGPPGEHQQKITPDRFEKPEALTGHPPALRAYEGRPVGGGGAFHPHEPRRQPPPPEYYASRPPPPPHGQHMHLSPRGTRYYTRNVPRPRMEAGFPPQGYFDHRHYNDYSQGRPPYDGPPPGYRVAYPGQYPPPTYGGGYSPEGRYQQGPPPSHHYANYPSQSGPPEHYPRDPRYGERHHPVSRAVSSSFDRSIKGGEKHVPGGPHKPSYPSTPGEDGSVASGDSSWRQLKQVHSVDDSAIRERLHQDKVENSEEVELEKQPASTSSSLTNSPTEGAARLHAANEAQRVVAAAAAAVHQKQPSSLDSLSSVASAQQPLDTKKQGKPAPPSPGTESLDLMKCATGSSGLLPLPSADGKRGRDEERGDVDTAGGGGSADEIRRAPSEAEPTAKKVRLEDDEGGKAGYESKSKSPLSITCSPSADKSKTTSNAGTTSSAKADYHASPQPMEGSYYDKPPAYSYSMDSAPSLPRDGHPPLRKQTSYPSLPPRPASSNSSTITPGAMQTEHANVHGVASWEIHAQDSFGNASIGGGHGLNSSFSFQDYPTLPPNDSDGGSHGPVGAPPLPPPVHHHAASHQQPLESRNQSFDGAHYHRSSSFQRSDSMDAGYPGGGAMSYGLGHQGQFPPHAPSWGTAGSSGSYHPPGHFGPYGGRGPHDYPVMRNFSHDSAHRASPPMGPGMHPLRRGPPVGFQPPSEFAAPHNPHLTRRPPPAVYIMPTSQGGGSKRGGGVFSWSKDDDSRLTEIMKKHKNPRDWEPIATEHGRGKTAKECHERWIRYLKPGVRKGQWTDQEDAIVIEAVTTSAEQPFTRWSDLAQQLPGRVGKQIRDRWVNHLNPNINHLPFSREDDLNLWNGHKKLGKRWVEISTKFFNSSRSENHIKNRWYSASFKKFICNEFGPDAYSGTTKSTGKKDKKKKSSTKQHDEDDDPTIEVV